MFSLRSLATALQRSLSIFQRYTIVIGFNFLYLSVAPALRSFLIPELYSEQSYTRVRAVELWFKHFRVQQFDTSHVRNTFRKNARGCKQEYSHVQEKTCASNKAAFIYDKTKLFRYYTHLIFLILRSIQRSCIKNSTF